MRLITYGLAKAKAVKQTSPMSREIKMYFHLPPPTKNIASPAKTIIRKVSVSGWISKIKPLMATSTENGKNPYFQVSILSLYFVTQAEKKIIKPILRSSEGWKVAKP